MTIQIDEHTALEQFNEMASYIKQVMPINSPDNTIPLNGVYVGKEIPLRPGKYNPTKHFGSSDLQEFIQESIVISHETDRQVYLSTAFYNVKRMPNGLSNLTQAAYGSQTLYGDIDFKHNPQITDLETALAELERIANETNMKQFGLNYCAVATGNGIHWYLPLTTMLAPNHWKVVAEQIKPLFEKHNIKVDVSDVIVQVLRMPGTINRKDPSNLKHVTMPVKLPVDDNGNHIRNDIAQVKEWIKSNGLEIRDPETISIGGGAFIPANGHIPFTASNVTGYDAILEKYPNHQLSFPNRNATGTVNGLLKGEKLEKLINALKCLPVEYYDDYNLRAKVIGFALKTHACLSEPDAQVMCDIWEVASKLNPKYTPQKCEKQWNDFRGDHPNPRTLKTIYRAASEHGFEWTDPDIASGDTECKWNDNAEFYFNAWIQQGGELKMSELTARLSNLGSPLNAKAIGANLKAWCDSKGYEISNKKVRVGDTLERIYSGIQFIDPSDGNGEVVLIPEQVEAIEGAVDFVFNKAETSERKSPRNYTYRIEGPAGTGKTSIALEIQKRIMDKLQELHPDICGEELDEAVHVVTFTNKAGDVLKNKGLINVNTIASATCDYVEDDEGNFAFVWNRAKPISNATAIIVDESSMVGQVNGENITRYRIPVIAIGDPRQLPPVDDPDDFDDAEGDTGYFQSTQRFGKKPDIELKTIHRQAGTSTIPFYANHVFLGRKINYEDSRDDFNIINPHDCTNEEWTQLLLHYAKNENAIITGTNANRKSINKEVRKAKGIPFTKQMPQVGEKIIAMVSVKTKGIFNGTVYIVRRIIPEMSDKDGYAMELQNIKTNSLTIRKCMRHTMNASHQTTADHWKINRKRYVENGIFWFDYAYAISCHKSQGSQYEHIMVLDESGRFGDGRKWLYTAFTRAQKTVLMLKRTLHGLMPEAILGTWVEPDNMNLPQPVVKKKSKKQFPVPANINSPDNAKEVAQQKVDELTSIIATLNAA